MGKALLKELVQKLADARTAEKRAADLLRQAVDVMGSAVQALPETAALGAAQAAYASAVQSLRENETRRLAAEKATAAKAEAERLYNTVRDEALVEWNDSKDKHPHPAVGIQVNIRIEADPIIVRDICFQRAWIEMLQVDPKAWNEFAAHYPVTDIPGINRVEVPIAKVDTDLSKWATETS